MHRATLGTDLNPGPDRSPDDRYQEEAAMGFRAVAAAQPPLDTKGATQTARQTTTVDGGARPPVSSSERSDVREPR